MTIYLVRHGEIGEGAGRRYIGQTDLPLSPEGERQAEALSGWLADKPVEAVFCSDLTRALQTARAIAAPHHLELRVRKDLREIALGEWEGLPRNEVAARFPEQYAARGQDIVNYRVPGGESFADCHARASRVWEEIQASNLNAVVIAAHAGVNRLLLCHALGLPANRVMDFAQDYGCLNVLHRDGGKYVAELVNTRPD